MVGIKHYKASADFIYQSFTDKIPEETTMHFMDYNSMLREHRGLKKKGFPSLLLGKRPHGDNRKTKPILLCKLEKIIQENILLEHNETKQ